MTKAELMVKVAEEAKLTRKDAEQAVNTVLNSISNALAEGDKVSIAGFGVFEVRERAAHPGRNPRTGEPMTIAAAKVPGFKAGKALKDAVAK